MTITVNGIRVAATEETVYNLFWGILGIASCIRLFADGDEMMVAFEGAQQELRSRNIRPLGLEVTQAYVDRLCQARNLPPVTVLYHDCCNNWLAARG